MGGNQAGDDRAPAHAFDEHIVRLREAICTQSGDHGFHSMDGDRTAEIRWAAGLAISGLRDGDSQVSATRKFMEYTPVEIDLSARRWLRFLMSVEKDDGGPGARAGGLFQKVLDVPGGIVRMGDEERLRVQGVAR